MKPSKLTVAELFQIHKQYAVPLYQRPYVWARETQWEPLWEDVERIAESLATGHRAVPHFLGAVVLAQHETQVTEIEKRDVIDGQQRLTTLQVLLAALRDHVAAAREAAKGTPAEEALQDLDESVRPLTRNRGVMHDAEVEKHKVWPTNADRVVFAKVLAAGSRAKLDADYPIVKQKYKRTPDPGPQLVEAYRYFSRAIEGFVAANTSGAKVPPLAAIYYAFQRYLQLVVIDLEREDDPQTIFQSLNGHGAPLGASDLIRNHVFGRAREQGANPDALYDAHWKHFDEAGAQGVPGFWRQKVKQGRFFHPRFELFFQHYLAARTSDDVTPQRVFVVFRDYWSNQDPEPSVPTELARIARFSEVFRWLYEPGRVPTTMPEVSRFFRRARAIDTSTFHPLVLYLLAEATDHLAPGALVETIAAIESYLVRTFICGSNTKNFNRIFTVLLQQLKGLKTIDGDAVRSRLLAIKGDAAWPDDAAFKSAWLRRPVYETLRTQGVQMVLGAVHDQMLTSKNEQVTIAGPLTVEHVMPRNWRAKWTAPAPIANATPDQPTAEQRRDTLVQTFGNLTLLTGPLNSAVQDDVFARKKAEYAAHALLRLNTHFQTVQTWDEDAILERGEKLFAHAKAIWKHGA